MKKVILLGIDGADWDIIKPLIADGSLTTFDEVICDGFSGVLNSTIPPFSLPAWTSIFTGTNPGKHGIIDTIIREAKQFKIACSNYRMVDPLWRLLGRRGLTSIIVNEPCSFPPDKLNGIMTTGMMTPPKTDNFAFPSTIIPELNKAVGGYWCDIPDVYYKFIEKNNKKALDLLNQFATKTFRAGIYLAENYEWNFLAIILTSTDRLQHFYINHPEYVKNHYQLVDKILASLLSLANSEEAQLIVVSDHGFKTIKHFFNVNALLKDLGLQKRNFLHNLFGQLNPHFRSKLKVLASRMRLATKIRLDMNKGEKAFAKTSSGIYVTTTLNSIEKELLIKQLKDVLSRVKGPDGKPPIKEALRREEVLWGPYVNRAPEIMLLSNDGYEVASDPFTTKMFETPYYKNAPLKGAHRLQGIFLAYGSFIKKHFHSKEHIFTWDVTPTILHILGLPIPNYMDGHVKKEIFKDGSDPATRSVKLVNVSRQERFSYQLKNLRKVRNARPNRAGKRVEK